MVWYVTINGRIAFEGTKAECVERARLYRTSLKARGKTATVRVERD